MKTSLSKCSTATLACALVIASPTSTAVAGDKQMPISHPAVAPAAPDPDLPLPFGIGVFYLYQEQDFKITDLDADMPVLKPPRITKLPPGVIPAGLPEPYASQAYAAALKAAQQEANRLFAKEMARLPAFGLRSIRDIEIEVEHVTARLDWWALPFLNVHGIYGQLEGKGTATLEPALASIFGKLSVPYDGQSYGGGITLSAGWHDVFASVTADYTWSDVDLKPRGTLKLQDPDGIGTLVIAPRIGYRFRDVAVWVGAHYQHTEHTQEGSFNLPPLGDIRFRGEVEDADDWNPIAGFEWRINRHWSLTAQGGFGARKQALAGLTFRF